MAKLQRKRSKALGSSLEMSQIMDAGTNKIKRRIRDLERLLKKEERYTSIHSNNRKGKKFASFTVGIAE